MDFIPEMLHKQESITGLPHQTYIRQWVREMMVFSSSVFLFAVFCSQDEFHKKWNSIQNVSILAANTLETFNQYIENQSCYSHKLWAEQDSFCSSYIPITIQIDCEKATILQDQSSDRGNVFPIVR